MADLLATLGAADLRRTVKLRQTLQCLTAPAEAGLLTDQPIAEVQAVVTIDGGDRRATMFVYGSGDVVSGSLGATGKWETGELTEMMWALKQGKRAQGDAGAPVFVDVGANVGTFTVNMAKLGYRVLAFEGTPDNYRLLQSTLCANPDFAPRVVLYPVGLSYFNSSCEIFTHPGNQGNGVVACDEDVRKRNFVISNSYIKRGTMELRRLDDLMLPTDVVSAMKIDTEGHELNVIKGGAGLFSRGGVRYVMMEVLKDLMGEDKTKELLAMLTTFGFRISARSFQGPWLTPAEVAAASVQHGANIFCAHESTFALR